MPYYIQWVVRVKNANWQEGWSEGYLHQHGQQAEDLNTGYGLEELVAHSHKLFSKIPSPSPPRATGSLYR